MNVFMFPGWCVTVICCLLGLSAPPGGAEDVFSSLTTLRRLYDKHDAMLSLVENYIAEEKDRLTELQMRLDTQRKRMKNIKKHPNKGVADVNHPLVAYSLVRDLHSLEYQVSNTYPADVLRQDIEEAGLQWPGDDDLDGAMLGIIRLQRTYKLSIDDIAAGIIHGQRAPVTLNGRDFFNMARLAMDRGQMTTAYTWMERVPSYRAQDMSQAETFYHLAKIYEHMLLPNEALGYMQMAYRIDPGDKKLRRGYKTLQRLVDSKEGVRNTIYVEPKPQWRDPFERACMEGQRKEVASGVWCEYRVHTLPYTPYKMEVISPDPWIVIYYGVISNTEAEYFKTLSRPGLQRARVGLSNERMYSEDRIGKLKHLFDSDDDPFPKKMSRRVQDVTGLVTSSHHGLANAEKFNVVNYGIGGHYGTHFDLLLNKTVLGTESLDLRGSGDRIATFMFYVSDVEAGGATVFPVVDVYVPPIKNSAVFWYNLHRDGTPDLRTQHAACPVLLGEKWVVTKWIREGGQLFRRPCGPEAMSTEPESQRARRGFRGARKPHISPREFVFLM